MKKLKNKVFYLYSVLLYGILAVTAFVLSIMFLSLDSKSYFISNFAASQDGLNNSAVLVIVDQKTDDYKKWNREQLTELLDYFDTYAKVKVIAIDSTITGIDKNRASDRKFLNKVAKMKNLVVGFTPSVILKTDSEKSLLKEFEQKAALKVTDNTTRQTKSVYKAISKVEKPILDTISNFASVLILSDKNSGKAFHSSNLIKINDKYYPSLALKTYLTANDTNEIVLDDNFITIPKTNRKIPIQKIESGKFLTNIKYYAYPQITNEKENIVFTHFEEPAYKILNIYHKLKSNEPLTKEEAGIHQLFNKNTPVFIGEFIDGPGKQTTDAMLTPMSNRHPGVDVQASVFSNIENNDFLYEPEFFGNLIPVILIALITFICVFRFSFIKSIATIVLLDVIFFIICIICAWCGWLLDFITPIAVQLVTLIFGFSFKFINENRNKEKIKQAMGKYLSQDIMKNVVSNIDDLKLGGKRAIVTVLFSDIRGFTSLSEKMTAEEVSVILNEYFAEMEPIITKYNGVINKFIGDAVMAIFGEPIQDINHPQNAVKCAYEMLKKVEYLREKWIFEGKPKIEIGVGINTGEVFIGNIGTETRMEYTVIGDTVNLASRIESYNKVYKTNLLVSSSTYSHIADIADVIKISEVQIRGKAKKMNIYEVLRIDKNR